MDRAEFFGASAKIYHTGRAGIGKTRELIDIVSDAGEFPQDRFEVFTDADLFIQRRED